jgi:putative ABC transport system permease protein
MAALDQALETFRYQAVPVKQNGLTMADETGSIFLSLFLIFGLFSISVGVLLIFLIFVMLAAERKSEMGMARAVGMRRKHLTQMFIAEGITYDLVAALIGAALGVGVAFLMASFMGRLMGDYFAITPTASWRSLIIAYTLGVVVTFVTIVISSWRVSRLNIVQAIRDVPEPALERATRRWLLFGVLGVVFGVLMTWTGVATRQAFPLMLGLSLIPLGLAAALRHFGVPARPLYSIAATLVLALWLLPESVMNKVFPKTTGSIEMFFLSGIMLVAAATVLIVWNAPVFTWLIGQAGRSLSRWLPAMKTAVAYPLERKGRTGMTIAMFSLVIFALVMMATMMATASKLVYGTEEASAGWDIQAAQSPLNTIADLPATLSAAGVDTRDIQAVGVLQIVDQTRSQVRMAGDAEWSSYMIAGADDGFLIESVMPLQARAIGYDSDSAVWAAVREGANLAVIDNNALAGQMMFGDVGFQLRGVTATDEVFEPVSIQLGEPVSGRVNTVTIIGVIDTRVVTFPGITMSRATYDATFRDKASTSYILHTVRVEPGSDAEGMARAIESTLLPYGVQASTYREIIDEYSRMSMGMLRLIEGFMILGLVVGVAALGVIAFRSVVERRQQIGMLRAIGFQRRMVSASFMIEASMLTILGIISGTVLALLLSWQLVRSEYFYGGSETPSFVIPLLDIGAFVVIALSASLLMAWIPARRAAKVPIAESLRYE